MLTGSCLCGKVQYEIAGDAICMGSCHCSQCRKFHGAAAFCYIEIYSKDFSYVSGGEFVKNYQRFSTSTVKRSFCSECGSSLAFIWDEMAEKIWIAAGTLNEDPKVRLDHHIFATSKAPWDEILDHHPQYERGRYSSDS